VGFVVLGGGVWGGGGVGGVVGGCLGGCFFLGGAGVEFVG